MVGSEASGLEVKHITIAIISYEERAIFLIALLCCKANREGNYEDWLL